MQRPLLLVYLSLLTSVMAAPKPVPRMQVVPQPHGELSFQRNGVELTRYHFAKDQQRPFLFPVNGPAGRSLTRLGHPRDPVTHSHHNSVWLSHQSVNGTNFWEDRGSAHIEHQKVTLLEDGDSAAFAETINAWKAADGAVLMDEVRRITVQSLPDGEWMLVIDARFIPREQDVVLGQTAFGMFAVRMAKTLGVADGGGTIRNSEGGVDEAGCFRKPARWVDYSGPITPAAQEGLTLFDHPQNLHHPVPFHVRNDGWMGTALTFPAAHTIPKGGELRLRYGLYVHAGVPSAEQVQERWAGFAANDFPKLLSKP